MSSSRGCTCHSAECGIRHYPPLDPPGDSGCEKATGLVVGPTSSLSVSQDTPDSGVLVLPTTMASAAPVEVGSPLAGRLGDMDEGVQLGVHLVDVRQVCLDHLHGAHLSGSDGYCDLDGGGANPGGAGVRGWISGHG